MQTKEQVLGCHFLDVFSVEASDLAKVDARTALHTAHYTLHARYVCILNDTHPQSTHPCCV